MISSDTIRSMMPKDWSTSQGCQAEEMIIDMGTMDDFRFVRLLSRYADHIRMDVESVFWFKWKVGKDKILTIKAKDGGFMD